MLNIEPENNPCDAPNCQNEADHMFTEGIGFSMFCGNHFPPAEAGRLRRIADRNRIAARRVNRG